MSLKVHLELARASNLPTVWSNVLCAVFLAQGSVGFETLAILIAASAFYTAGMYLNDWFDHKFDAKHKRSRPIPRKAIKRQEVLYVGVGLIAVGLLMSLSMGMASILAAVALVTLIVLYDAFHKQNNAGPFLMAGCRFMLVVWAALSAVGSAPKAVWLHAGLLFAYVVGLSFVARSSRVSKQLFGVCTGIVFGPAIVYALHLSGFGNLWSWLCLLVLIGWMLRSVLAFRQTPPQIDRGVEGLLAGFVLIDALALSAHYAPWSLILGLLVLGFPITLFLQKRIAAT